MMDLRLNILAFGSRLMLQRLIARANPDEVSITPCTETSTAAEILQKEQFDMVIVDDSAQDAEFVCHRLTTGAGLPVAVMFNHNIVDWKKLRFLEVDGYLPEEASGPELMARIKAFSRRQIAIRQSPVQEMLQA